MKHNAKWTWMAMVLVWVMMSTMIGCTDLQGAMVRAQEIRDNARAIGVDLQGQLETFEHQRRSVPDGSVDAKHLDGLISMTQAKIHGIDGAIAQADLVIAEAQNPTDSLTIAIDAISPWVPAPIQGPMLLGGALIASLMRSRNLKQSAVSIVGSIEHLLKADEQFRALFASHANTIRTIQTPGARKMVDSIGRKSVG